MSTLPSSPSEKIVKKVARTSLFVAFLRSYEPMLHPDDPLFVDPYSEALAGDVEESELSPTAACSKKSMGWYISLASIRTRKIDDQMKDILSQHSIKQVCVLGAGVDARPWRLQTTLPDQSHIKYYEVDFPEIFDYKLPILQAHCAKELFDYKKVEADLSLPSWLEKLERAGFDRGERTLWLLEGLTGYLTEEAAHALFSSISEITALHSYLIATFLTPVALLNSLRLHQYAPENPLGFVEGYGWEGEQVDIEDYAIALGRSTAPDEVTRGYYLVTVEKTK
jgi:methyltransferase (TIGR00027 family)